MNTNDIPPKTSWPVWIEHWHQFYDYKRYPETEYVTGMVDAAKAKDKDSLINALQRIFSWKEKRRLAWPKVIERISYSDWLRWQHSDEIPKAFAFGVVFNAFLAHVASNGRRPIIDQHVWRAYCCITSRVQWKELGKINNNTAIKCYLEYECWFRALVKEGLDARKLDKALMAFGKSCPRQS